MNLEVKFHKIYDDNEKNTGLNLRFYVNRILKNGDFSTYIFDSVSNYQIIL